MRWTTSCTPVPWARSLLRLRHPSQAYQFALCTGDTEFLRLVLREALARDRPGVPRARAKPRRADVRTRPFRRAAPRRCVHPWWCGLHRRRTGRTRPRGDAREADRGFGPLQRDLRAERHRVHHGFGHRRQPRHHRSRDDHGRGRAPHRQRPPVAVDVQRLAAGGIRAVGLGSGWGVAAGSSQGAKADQRRRHALDRARGLRPARRAAGSHQVELGAGDADRHRVVRTPARSAGQPDVVRVPVAAAS